MVGLPGLGLFSLLFLDCFICAFTCGCAGTHCRGLHVVAAQQAPLSSVRRLLVRGFSRGRARRCVLGALGAAVPLALSTQAQ